jgi:hypothetical protein
MELVEQSIAGSGVGKLCALIIVVSNNEMLKMNRIFFMLKCF